MRSISNLLIDPLIQSHWCDSILADTNSLAIRLVSNRGSLRELEHAPGTSRDVRDCSWTQTLLCRDRGHTLVNLDCRQPPIQRIPFGCDCLYLLRLTPFKPALQI